MALTLPELPEDIQRIIVLLLPPKAFTRSSILSKSWLSFYNSTRCSFNFILHSDPVQEESMEEIVNFVESLSASFLRERLTVDEFNINMELDKYSNFRFTDQLTRLVHKWLNALFTKNNLVIVKVLRIQISSQARGMFHMPPKLFFHGSLQVLHLKNIHHIHPNNQILGCLRVLSLQNADSESTNRLLTACPNLEQLTLSTDLGGQNIIIKGLRKLTDLDICGFADVRIHEAPALENVYLKGYNDDDRTSINSQVSRRIKFLSMYVNSERTAMLVQKIVSYLPELENLIKFMVCATDITISSGCLQNLELFICVDQDLMHIEIDQPRYVLELRKALRMIEQLKLGVDTAKLVYGKHVCVKASRLDEKLNVSASRVIEMLDAGALKFDVDGNFCF